MKRYCVKDKTKQSECGRVRRSYISEGSEFLIAVLREALKWLPARIFINGLGNGYCIRDCRGRVVWADDLPINGVICLIENLSFLYFRDSSLLACRFEQAKRNLEAQEQHYLTCRNFTLCSNSRAAQGELITVDIQFELDESCENYEILIKRG